MTPALDLTALGTRLAHARHRARLSQTVAAQRAGIAVSTWARLETPSRTAGPGPNAATLQACCDALGISLDWLLGPVQKKAW